MISIDMNMQENCRDCAFCGDVQGECLASGDGSANSNMEYVTEYASYRLFGSGKPDWCPLKETKPPKEIMIDALKRAREAIENKGNEHKMPYQEHMVYAFGLRDACWAIDHLISEIQEQQ